MTIEKDEDFAKYKGTLKGKFVLLSPTRDVAAFFESPTRRYTETGARRTSREAASGGGRVRRVPPALGLRRRAWRCARSAWRSSRKRACSRIVEISAGDARRQRRGHRVRARCRATATVTVEGQVPVPQVVLAAEHYGRMLRVLDKKVPVTV